MANNIDIVEQFCEATSIIANKLLEKVAYDTTISCTIVDDSDRLNGVYWVSNGSAKFKAFSSETGYRNKNNVYVQIPNGDWGQDKIILSKKPSQKEDPVTVARPFDTFVDITGNLITAPIKVVSLLANERKQDFLEDKIYYNAINLWSYNKTEKDYTYEEKGSEYGGYTRLGIKASFQTWLKELGAAKGDYGLKVIIEAALDDEQGQEKDKNSGAETADKETEIYEFFLNPNNMIGDPYNYENFYRQEVLINLEQYNITKIKNIRIQFYENSGTFKDSYNNLIPYRDENTGMLLTDNIFVQDIYLSLGYDSTSFDTDTVYIYTMDDTQYIATEDPPEDNHKKLQVRWIHKDENGVYKSITRADGLEYELTWYRKKLGHRSDTVYSGVDWKPLSKQIANSEGMMYEILDPDWKEYNLIADSSIDGVIREPEFNVSWSIPDVTRATESIKAILMYEGRPCYSNILTFTNRKEVVSQPTVAAIQALSINCEDKSYGNYMIYNLGGQIVDQADSSEVREFKLYFNENGDLSETASQLTNAESIEWIIPTNQTMIDVPEDFYATGEEESYFDADGYLHIFRYGDKTNSYAIENHNTQRYRIKNFYTQANGNNIIKCNIIKDKITYSAVKELTFGPTGTSGTDYTFIIDFDKGVTALTVGDMSAVTVTARLYDYEGIELPIDDKIVTWQWANAGEEEIFPIEIVDAGIEYYQKEIKLVNGITSVPNKNFCILEAILSNWGDYELHAYLPIPIRRSINYQYISGTTTICYDSLGTLSNFYQNPYVLHLQEKKDTITSWEIEYQNEEKEIVRYAPRLIRNTNGSYYLRPLTIYVENSVDKVCVNCLVNNQIVWSQPVYIYQNKYPSTLINKWNGELIIDEENNAILAAKVVAGKKENDNTFSGVIMGEWDDPETEAGIGNGVYGFRKGSSSFGFRNDGTAYIGLPSAGRIEFDGSKSIITSAAFENKIGGMEMNFCDGTIDMRTPGEYGNSDKRILFDVRKTSNPFQIGTKFYVDWDGTLTASNGNFYGTVTADYIYAWSSYFDSLTAADAEITDLTVSGKFGTNTIYFGWPTDTKYTYYINRYGWEQIVSKTTYENFAGPKRETKTITYDTSNVNKCAGYIGAFKGAYPLDNGALVDTKVIGLQCKDSTYNIVIEGANDIESTIRIGNQARNQPIYISGLRNVLQSNSGSSFSAFCDSYINKKLTVDLYQGSNNAYYIMLQADKYLLRLNSNGELFTNCPAGSQSGFYARFA